MGAARSDDGVQSATGGVLPPESVFPPGFPVVAIGASAGGLEALSRFFDAMPPHPGFGFVVVVHLAASHASHMPELLARHTSMPVTQVGDDAAEPLRPDHVHVIPPNRWLEISGGQLRTGPLGHPGPAPLPIDRFFRSLAEDRMERAVCIVLSGTGADGSGGLRDIKAGGGLVMAQSPDTALHGGMPRSAIATGLVDVVLPVEQMPRALLEYALHARLHGAAAAADAAAPADAAVLQDIVALLRARAGQDFRGYKVPMLMRRVRRRMGLARVHGMADYHVLLRETPEEITRLSKDLLIGVTAFFRDPEAWSELASQVIAPMLAEAGDESAFRIWVPGCSTGEEAYTVGILMAEQLQTLRDTRSRVTIFATDADGEVLDTGRAGRYPAHIASALSGERLARFFTHEGEHYVVRKELREMVMFAPQNLLADPPFSRLDLICCRNLLIYLAPEQQRKLITLFHFALNPGGHLMLGKSESIGHLHDLFEPALKRWRVYRRVGAGRRAGHDIAAARDGDARAQAPSRRTPAPAGGRPGGLGEVVQRLLLAHCAPAALLIDREQRVLYIAGPTEDFLIQPGGEPSNELLAMVREGLRLRLRALLHKVQQEGAAASGAVPLTRHGKTLRVDIGVMPVREPGLDAGMLLVTFSARPAPAAAPSAMAAPNEGDEHAIRQLEEELQVARRDLQGAIEELESANEELKVANEEAMSTNEELQSANEELETSKEELQSLNEELTTVNSQLEEKVVELETANNDLTNLLTSTHLPTLFLDRQLRIKRFTPQVTRLFSLIATDVDRPVTDIASRFPIDELLADARRVLEQLAPIEREMQCDGEHYLRRALPYRTHEDRIEGVVFTFTDVSELRRAAEDLRRSEAMSRGQAEELDALYQSRPIGLALFDRELRCLRLNEALAESFGVAASQAVGRPMAECLPWLAHSLLPVVAPVLEGGKTLLNREVHEPAAAGPVGADNAGSAGSADSADGRREWLASLYPLKNAQGEVRSVSAVVVEVTEHRRAADEIRRGRARLRRMVDTSQVGIAVVRADGRVPEVNDALLKMLGYDRQDLGQGEVSLRLPSGEALIGEQDLARLALGGGTGPVEKTLVRKDGTHLEVLASASGLGNGDDEHVVFVVDLTEPKLAQQRLRAAEDLTAQIERAREEDRARIAREIHDELGAALTAIKMRLQAARAEAAARKRRLPSALDEMPGLIDGATQAVNRIIGDLRPSVLDHLGVWAAIRWYAERVLPGAGVAHEVAIADELQAQAIGADRATAIFRIAQEALTNVVRHADATHVSIRATADDTGTLMLEIQDDGKGIEPDPSFDTAAGGLLGMRERARRFGGELSVSATALRGTTVVLSMPLRD